MIPRTEDRFMWYWDSSNEKWIKWDGSVSATQSGTWDIGTLTSITNALPEGDNAIGAIEIKDPTNDYRANLIRFDAGAIAVPGNVYGLCTLGYMWVSNSAYTAQLPLVGNAGSLWVSLQTALPVGTNTIGNINAIQSGTWNIGTVTTVSAVTSITDAVTIAASDNQIGGVMINGGDGTKSDTSLTLTSQSTAYATTAAGGISPKPYLMLVHNASDTDVYFRFTTGTTLGTLLASGKSLTIDMGMSQVLYFYCPTAAGKVINYSTRCNH